MVSATASQSQDLCPRRFESRPAHCFFSFLQHFLSFNLKVLCFLLRFSQARAWVGLIDTRTQSIIFNYIHWEEESPLANIDLPLRGLMRIRFSLPFSPLSISLSLSVSPSPEQLLIIGFIVSYMFPPLLVSYTD